MAQKPLVADEMRFIAEHPDIVRELLTMTPLTVPAFDTVTD